MTQDNLNYKRGAQSALRIQRAQSR